MKFVTHESIAAGCFSVGFAAALPAQAAWREELTAGQKSLELLCERMERDYAALHPKMRKTWQVRDVALRLELATFFSGVRP